MKQGQPSALLFPLSPQLRTDWCWVARQDQWHGGGRLALCSTGEAGSGSLNGSATFDFALPVSPKGRRQGLLGVE